MLNNWDPIITKGLRFNEFLVIVVPWIHSHCGLKNSQWLRFDQSSKIEVQLILDDWGLINPQ
jgi:hypothetical protein